MRSPIFEFNAARSSIVDEVVARVLAATKDPALSLNEAAYHEMRRLGGSGSTELLQWKAIARGLGRQGHEELTHTLEEIVRRLAWDVAGNFDPRVYRIASRAIAPLVGAILAPKYTATHLSRAFDLRALDDRVVVEGPIDHVRGLARIGTLVFVPTHLSNFDSPVFGYAIERAQLPPATYGAGKNLFTNPVLSFFMHNLGAYRVDRRLRYSLYKEVLKNYSCVLLERGYHSLFFPGGTRSRSGGVERKLKLGLAGTGIEAFARTTIAGKPQPVFFVPATINYLLTLEAETLIDDFLQEEGKARYIIEDDESTRFGRVAAFMNKLASMDGGVVVRFSTPLDCFGNTVSEDGQSYDAHGRRVSAASYIYDTSDRPTRNPRREAEYTRELADSICAAYLRDTVILPTHVVAAAAFQALLHRVGQADIFTLLRHKEDVVVGRGQLAEDVARLRDRAKEMAERGELVLGPGLAHTGGHEILDGALRAFSGYHEAPVLEPRGADIALTDPRLLFYYQNRLAAHGLALDVLQPTRKKAA
jgi:glycerol-3-phosphate O-acyltransferase